MFLILCAKLRGEGGTIFLARENAKLKRLVSELSPEKLVLKDIASGNF
jgi:hypothetical protein